ncbi:MAG: L,D-transpeptidase family protein [Xanthobacteraceae bacterium]|jgi:lipoprotein-anchoring transpeptidase ErfK/SrfK|uniref:L,D-transpeptidase n=1 Tax=Pseudolabrys sp. TaxID=1960880 RepID=UPI003D0AFDFD
MIRLATAAAAATCLSVSVAGAQVYVVPQGQYAQAAQPRMVVVAPVHQQRAELGGGFIEFLFGDRGPQPAVVPPQQSYQPVYLATAPAAQDPTYAQPRMAVPIDPKYLPQDVAYQGKEDAGTIVIDTPNRFLYLVEGNGRARRYGIGVGRPGFTWSGTHAVTAKREWPDWTPPEEMLQRQPYLPRHMDGGPNNPLGARALYLGSTLYRIHGSNEPWTIGQMVSSGCIRMRNEDVIDLYGRVKVGTKVVVI